MGRFEGTENMTDIAKILSSIADDFEKRSDNYLLISTRHSKANERALARVVSITWKTAETVLRHHALKSVAPKRIKDLTKFR